MNKGDILVCIKPYFMETSYSSVKNIKDGDQFTIDSIFKQGISKDGVTKTARDDKSKYEDIEMITITNGEIKESFYDKKLKYRYCIHDYFTTLATFRDKRIDEILKND
jgi:hypothetical protein